MFRCGQLMFALDDPRNDAPSYKPRHERCGTNPTLMSDFQTITGSSMPPACV